MKNFFDLLRWVKNLTIFGVFTAILVGLVIVFDDRVTPEIGDASNLSGIAYISDGDSLRLNGVSIRILDIDAPELDQNCLRDRKPWACGLAAKKALTDFIAGRPVNCFGKGLDKYRRELARCEVGQKDIGQWMVLNGWAVSYGGYGLDEAYAKQKGNGIWQSEFEMPQAWRKRAGMNGSLFNILAGFFDRFNAK